MARRRLLQHRGKRRTMRIDKGMTVHCIRTKGKDYVYLKLRINGADGEKALGFTRADYDEKWEEWLTICKEFYEHKRRPPHWKANKPLFDDILNELGLIEEIHHRYRDDE